MLQPTPLDVKDPKGYLEGIAETLKSLVIPETYLAGIDTLMSQSTRLNETFLAGRGRIEQMQIAIADAIPSVTRLGGTVTQTVATMGEIAEATNRNFIAQEETVGELFAASQLLGSSVQTLSKAFIDVGFSIDEVGERLEESIYYIQSLGLNAGQVADAVVDNLDQLQRFQFEGGIQGLTKMAAQAAMLRVDMSTTLDFAERVMTPEGAIKMAEAFQRLGVAAGDLVDPFQLMNQSINDPTGLQTSIANVAKSFVYFSEEAGQFKINPEGVLRLKEIATETQIPYDRLVKMGVAASEMGERLKQVSMAGLKFEKEEDQQFLANISEMGKDGVYRVTLEDGTKVDINELNQQQFDRLIEREKDRPKTIEDMTRAQMDISKIVAQDVQTIRDKIVYGVVSMGPIPGLTEDFRSVTKAITEGISGEAIDSERLKVSDVRGSLGNVFNSLVDVMKQPGDMMENFQKWASESMNMDDLSGKLGGFLDNFVENVQSGFRKSSDNEMALSDIMSQFRTDVLNPLKTDGEKYKGQSFLEGSAPISTETTTKTTIDTTTPVMRGTLDMNIKHTFPPEFEKLSQSDQMKVFDNYLKSQMRSEEFKNYFFGLVDSRNQTLKQRG